MSGFALFWNAVLTKYTRRRGKKGRERDFGFVLVCYKEKRRKLDMVGALKPQFKSQIRAALIKRRH
jgi:hypothetical protein